MIADAAILQLPKVSLQAKQLLPEYSGIYYLLDQTNTVWYIGKAVNIRKRWQGKAHHRINQLKAQKKHFTIHYEPVSRTQLGEVEKQRIEKYQPHLNASPVKTKKVRPTETLLRETIAAIADFAFILGVEPPRKEVASQIHVDWLVKKKVVGLSVIHIYLDIAALKEKFEIESESIEEEEALIKSVFSTRKVYASKWEKFPPRNSFIYRLYVNGYAVEVKSWGLLKTKEELEGLPKYTQATLAQESIKSLTPESLARIQQQAERENRSALYSLQRLNPYTLDLIKPVFDEPVDRKAAEKKLAKVSEDYKAGRRGVGSFSKPVSIENLLISRGINLQKYGRREVIIMSGDRIGVYLQSFNVDYKLPYKHKICVNSPPYRYNSAFGILNNRRTRSAPSYQFDTVYLLASVEKNAWLLVEEYLKGFAKPATGLSNGEGCVQKFYVSARKFVVPAKVNIKLDNIGYSAWIPFGTSAAFPTYEAAKEEITRRLKNSDLPGLKLVFKRETIAK